MQVKITKPTTLGGWTVLPGAIVETENEIRARRLVEAGLAELAAPAAETATPPKATTRSRSSSRSSSSSGD